jgi:NAD(P)H dehydrogenase (quinone)
MVKFNPVKVLQVLCHPDASSFCHSAAGAARAALEGAGHGVLFHDLYAEGFDPVLTQSELLRRFSLDPAVQAHTRELEESGGLVILHPDWWGMPPALLKGWIDRVFRGGTAYEHEGGEFLQKTRVPLLASKRGLVFCTTDSEEPDHIAAIQGLWRHAILGSCGMEASCVILPGMRNADRRRRQSYIEQVDSAVRKSFPGA